MEKVVVESGGNALQQTNVDVVLTENSVYMRTGATDILRQLCGCHSFLFHYFLYVLPDMHKKRGIFTCRPSGFHAHFNNKLSHAYTGVS